MFTVSHERKLNDGASVVEDGSKITLVKSFHTFFPENHKLFSTMCFLQMVVTKGKKGAGKGKSFHKPQKSSKPDSKKNVVIPSKN